MGNREVDALLHKAPADAQSPRGWLYQKKPELGYVV
jgi:hypothetical protein